LSFIFPNEEELNNDTSIKVSELGIKFNLNYGKKLQLKTERLITLKSLLLHGKKKEFWALRHIGFEAKKGEIFGIIGGNGAGKSTLLKIIAGIYPPTEGDIQTEGTIAPLIELGAAFIPEMTGAENIFLTGSIYRIPIKTIKEQFQKIVEFSGLKNFIDTPVKNYSSGMFIRLAFSIVIFFQPDVVLIDEVFSVGDESFQQRSFEKILSFKQRGATILLVSHNSEIISQICDRALVLSQGEAPFCGPAQEAVSRYRQLTREREDLQEDDRFEKHPERNHESKRFGNKEVDLKTVRFVDAEEREKDAFYTGDYFEAQIPYESHLKDSRPVFGVAISTIYKLLIYGPNTLETPVEGTVRDKGIVRFIIPSLPLIEGDYLFSVAAYDPQLKTAYDHHENMYHFRVLSQGKKEFGSVKIESRWAFEGE